MRNWIWTMHYPCQWNKMHNNISCPLSIKRKTTWWLACWDVGNFQSSTVLSIVLNFPDQTSQPGEEESEDRIQRAPRQVFWWRGSVSWRNATEDFRIRSVLYLCYWSNRQKIKQTATGRLLWHICKAERHEWSHSVWNRTYNMYSLPSSR